MMVSEACIGTMTWGSFNAKEEQAHAQVRAVQTERCGQPKPNTVSLDLLARYALS